jgi:hypothetical protein
MRWMTGQTSRLAQAVATAAALVTAIVIPANAQANRHADRGYTSTTATPARCPGSTVRDRTQLLTSHRRGALNGLRGAIRRGA